MLLVVYGHVLTLALENYNASSAAYLFFERFRMPMFFFISGYIAFKPTSAWDFGFFKKMICKKALVQLLPTAIFFTLYCIAFGINIAVSFRLAGVGIYWFCQTLFEMFVLYYLTQLFCRYTSAKFFNWIIIALIIITKFLSQTLEAAEATAWQNALLLHRLLPYFAYFGIGLLCRKGEESFISFLKNDKVKAALIVAYLLMFTLHWHHDFAYGYAIDHATWKLLIRITGVMCVFAFFLSHADFFSRGGRLNRIMQFIGRRTLDIYLLHYFFIPDLSVCKDFILGHHMSLFELVFGFGVGALILAAALAASGILRRSDFLAHYLFGAKSQKK